MRATESACESVLPTSAKLVGSAIPWASAIRCRSASASPDADARRAAASGSAAASGAASWTKPGLVGGERRQREPENQVGDVVGAVLREREQQQAERPPRVVVEPAEQAEVEQREPAVVA